MLAVMTTVGFYLIYSKLPRRVRKFLEKHSLMSDLIACILTYTLLGGTLTALFASALVGIMTSLLLLIAQHPENFLYIFDFMNFVKRNLSSMTNGLNTYGAQYRDAKLMEQNNETAS
jgi:hypothetical protein